MGPKKPAGKASAAADASSGQPFQRPLYTISILKSGDPFGTLIMELAVDALPKTTENFKQLAAGVTVGDKKNPKTASYKGCRFLRLTDDGLQTGDALHKEDGKGNDSIYGPMFEDEAFGVYPHVFGTVSMCNSGPNTNGSQFFFCTAPRRSATTTAATSPVSPPSHIQARTSPDQDPSASSSPAPGSIAAPNNSNGNQPAAAAVVVSHLDSRCVSFGKIMEGSEDVLQRLIDELRPFVSTSLSSSSPGGGQGGVVVADNEDGVVSFDDGPTVGTIVPNAPFTIGSISPLS